MSVAVVYACPPATTAQSPPKGVRLGRLASTVDHGMAVRMRKTGVVLPLAVDIVLQPAAELADFLPRVKNCLQNMARRVQQVLSSRLLSF